MSFKVLLAGQKNSGNSNLGGGKSLVDASVNRSNLMARKKKTAEQIAAEIKHLNFVHAGYIRERFPHVISIAFDFAFRDGDSDKEVSRQSSSRGPEHSASFTFDCGDWECVHGGFDLSASIQSMLSSRQTELSGTAVCQGWQDRERIGKHRCYKKLVYRITAQYA